MASLIYLASPYSHNSAAVREHRFLQARRFTIMALKEGYSIFSPIVYGKDMEKEIGTDHTAWIGLNETMIKICGQMWVLQLHKWEDSLGIKQEIKLARDLGKPILYVPGEGV